MSKRWWTVGRMLCLAAAVCMTVSERWLDTPLPLAVWPVFALFVIADMILNRKEIFNVEIMVGGRLEKAFFALKHMLVFLLLSVLMAVNVAGWVSRSISAGVFGVISLAVSVLAVYAVWDVCKRKKNDIWLFRRPRLEDRLKTDDFQERG